MKRVCAWCNGPMEGTASGANSVAHVEVSHGICPSCAHHLFAQSGMSLKDYLDGLDVPVVATDGDLVAKLANRAAMEFVGLDSAVTQVAGLLGGQVFECENALLPGGCGHTIHCSGCEIRRSVMDTFATGIPRICVPACLKRTTSNGRQRVHLFISTVRVENNVVLLKIDSANVEAA